VKSVDAMFEGSFWDMPKFFALMNVARGIISFADFLLIVLTPAFSSSRFGSPSRYDRGLCG
jgi:hypothetical protein